MMINIQNQYATDDRWPLKITKLEPNSSRTFDATLGTYFLMLQNSSFYSDDAKFENVNAAISVNHSFTVNSNSGNAVVIEYPGLHLLESRYYVQNKLDMGNLSYMDGGTNTTAINPGRLGDPVINYVHFPNGMFQTLHTHPSHRVGMVVKGKGRVELDDGMFELNQGDVFFLRRNVLHNFHCPYDQDVVLFVFAPDTGTGPTDDVNPLKIRTYVGQQRYAK
jgi:mannose-6-phosphate isomerase-like protein (cupin superfamily)